MKPTVICITPVKNEGWILERFLLCTSLWADQIILADQQSDDGSREIARKFSKVRLIENPCPQFNEPERQKLLLDEARKVEGHKLIVALDADEFLTANFESAAEWREMLDSPPGTVIKFDWPTVLEEAKAYWMYPHKVPLAFMDDEISLHQGQKIHSPRIPVPASAPTIEMDEVKVMHFVGADPQRWKSKIRWYQCWTILNQPKTSMAELFRFYHKDFFIPQSEIHPIPRSWLQMYQERGIDLNHIESEGHYRWDLEVLRLLEDHGPDKFRKLDIWDYDWNALRSRFGCKREDEIRDPRRLFDRVALGWLRRNQPYYSHFRPPVSFPRRLEIALMVRLLRAGRWDRNA